MSIDWGKLETENSSQYKDYAPDGTYKVKCVDVEVKEVGSNGSVVEKFIFEEDNRYKYPTADHWISKKNDNWRAWHQMNLMKVLGASEENAKTATEKAEAKDFAFAVKTYEALLKTLLKKNPEVEIEVYTDGKYARSEFTDRSVAMPHNDAKKPASDPIVEDGEEEIDLSEIPF